MAELIDAYNYLSIFVTVLATLAWIHSVYFAWRLGTNGYSKLRLDGPYEVGVRYGRTQKRGTELAIFYPVDKERFI